MMRSTIFVVAALLAIWVPPTAVFAGDAEDFEAMKKLVDMGGGNRNEGRQDNRNRFGTGSVKDWLTYPAEKYFKPKSEAEVYVGTIAYHFTGRERVADYVLGQQRDTNDYQTNGRVTADYEITRSGDLLIKNVHKHGSRGKVGDSVFKHITSLNGKSVR